jgi:hypothetical protein
VEDGSQRKNSQRAGLGPAEVEKAGMADLWVVLSVVAFFGLCVALVRGCDHIIGPDEDSDLRDETELSDAELAEAVR